MKTIIVEIAHNLIPDFFENEIDNIKTVISTIRTRIPLPKVTIIDNKKLKLNQCKITYCKHDRGINYITNFDQRIILLNSESKLKEFRIIFHKIFEYKILFHINCHQKDK